MDNWYNIPHHNTHGELEKDLKYKDRPVFVQETYREKLPDGLNDALSTIKWQRELWEKRML